MKYDCVIIGSGVAGLSAALYLARANKSVIIIENGTVGGTTATIDLIENYPGIEAITGQDLIQTMMMQVMHLGVNIDFLNIKSINFDKKAVNCENISIEYKTLIIASGQSVNKLNIAEEDSFRFKGLSYCAVCDGALYKGKNIAVVCSGNSGNSAISYLKNITDKLIVINDKIVSETNDYILYSNSIVDKIKGSNFVESLIIKNKTTQQEKSIAVDAVFVCLGKKTNLTLFENSISCSDGYIVSDENMHTNIEGVFVAGDIRKKSLRQIITACSDGAIAGTEAIKFISKYNSQ